MNLCFVYITAASAEEARRIGRALVEERLAACANVIDGMTSTYWWEGRVQEDSEAILIAKTRESLLGALTERVKALHSYTCPCVVALPIGQGNPDYLDWLARETAPAEPG
ncbi:MAG: divalent-cation tolerance protein CutA [Alphaproteobacteria bacterium]